jgi:hypothetical protein
MLTRKRQNSLRNIRGQWNANLRARLGRPQHDRIASFTLDKRCAADAREFLRNAAGPTIPAGSSAELHLVRAVPVVNETIATQGAALDKILQAAKPLAESPKSAVTNALNTLKSDLPGGSEETLGRAIDKEATRYSQALESTNPVEIN